VINDFINSYAYISYVDYGLAQHLDVSITKGEVERQQKDDAIHVFYNYKKVGVYKTKEEAAAKVRELQSSLPRQCLDWLKQSDLGIMESLNV
jgi:hypothetical protein